MKKRKIIISVIVIFTVLLLIFAVLFGLSRLAHYHYTTRLAFSLSIWEQQFPNAFSMIDEKFGDDLEVIDAPPSGMSITYKYSAEFENKYNVNSKPTEEFLQDIADEWFECFHDEIAAELEKNYSYFPVAIGFRFEKGSEYELIVFSYEDFDKCNVFRHKKW